MNNIEHVACNIVYIQVHIIATCMHSGAHVDPAAAETHTPILSES